MSNAGVIKLGECCFNSHKMWLDDNIGESIHIHIDQLRIDLRIDEFEILCDNLRSVLTELIDKKGFDAHEFDARFMRDNINKISNIESIEITNIRVDMLQIKDDDGIVFLKDSARVKALAGKIDINATKRRGSNYITQSNKERLCDALSFIENNGYPFKNNYILVSADKNVILDGWHRAASIYYLHGNIEIPVKKIKFKEGVYNTPFFFPINKVKPKSNVIIYGAGDVGKSYVQQIRKSKFLNIKAWVDQRYQELGEVYGQKIISPSLIKNMEFDYIVIAILNNEVKKDVYEALIKLGVSESKIVE